jgi:phosphate transport system protein
MARSDYTQQLQEIQDDLLLLGSMVEKAIVKSVDALKSRDLESSQAVIEEDDVIDDFQMVLEEKCVDVIALQAPMASDLRRLVTVIQVASELERVGDYAEGIAKISVRMGEQPTLKPLIDIPRMAEMGAGMLREGLGALTTLDLELAVKIAATDDEVDSLYEQIFRELFSFMVENPANIQGATYLIWIAHLLERIADRATNIAERVVYLATGKMKHFQ